MIRESIDKQRKLLGWSKAKLAQESGLSRTLVTNFLNGKQSMLDYNVDKLLDVLGLKISRKIITQSLA